MQNRNNNYRNNNNQFLQQRYNNNIKLSRKWYINNNNNSQWNPGQYKIFNLGQFQNRNKPSENRFLQNNNTQQNLNYTEIICNYCKNPVI